MATHLEPDAPRSINCVKYLISELLKREPLKYGKTVKVRISEDSLNFPEFTDNILEDNQNLKPERRLREMEEDMGHKLIAISDFLLAKFKHHTVVLMPQVQSFNPFILDIPLVSLDPNGLYKMAEGLGINVEVNTDDKTSKSLGEVRFDEYIPELIFSDKRLPIKFGSLQFCLCRVAFARKVSEAISWDEVAEEIEGHQKNNLKSDWKRIYYVFRRLNNNFKHISGRDLFAWENKTFRRLV